MKTNCTMKRLPKLNNTKTIKCGHDQEMRRSSGTKTSAAGAGVPGVVMTDPASTAAGPDAEPAFAGSSWNKLIISPQSLMQVRQRRTAKANRGAPARRKPLPAKKHSKTKAARAQERVLRMFPVFRHDHFLLPGRPFAPRT